MSSTITPPLARSLEPLFTPYKVGPLQLRNRFVMPGMQRALCSDGLLHPEMADYYARRARGGAALIIGEGCAVDHWSSNWNSQFPRTAPAALEQWQRCATLVHEAGSAMLLQISHPGALRTESHALPGSTGPALSPSGLYGPDKTNGSPASAEELDEILKSFVTAAWFARQAGMDGIELHACHGFFLDQFLWAETNHRADRFGGPGIEQRATYPCAIVAAIRAAMGPDFVIAFRLSQWKEVDYAARIADTPDELGRLLGLLENAGVDILHASGRRFFDPAFPAEDDCSLAGWCKRLSALPVITVGSVGLATDVMTELVGTQDAGLDLLDNLAELGARFDRDEFDLIAVGRNLIADPDWINKLRDGDLGSMRPFRKEDLGEALEMEPDLIREIHS